MNGTVATGGAREVVVALDGQTAAATVVTARTGQPYVAGERVQVEIETFGSMGAGILLLIVPPLLGVCAYGGARLTQWPAAWAIGLGFGLLSAALLVTVERFFRARVGAEARIVGRADGAEGSVR